MSNGPDFELSESGGRAATEFEAQLFALRPTDSAQLCVEDTFYQAGWQAALASGQTSGRAVTAKTRRGAWFGSGIITGIAAAVLLMLAWSEVPFGGVPTETGVVANRQSPQRDIPIYADPMPRENTNIPDVAASVGTSELPDSEPASFAARSFLWTWPVPEVEPAAFVLADGPLSMAAQQQWGDMLSDAPSGARHRPGSESRSGTSKSEVPDAMRPSSARQWLNESLL